MSWGSRAICFAKRPLEILDRLGCGDPVVERGSQWRHGKVFFRDRQVYEFDLLPESGHKRPAFVNLQQYWFEVHLIERAEGARRRGKPIEIRGGNRVVSVERARDRCRARRGRDAGRPLFARGRLADRLRRRALADPLHARPRLRRPRIRGQFPHRRRGRWRRTFPTERWFWFDPPFNPGQSALLHKQPDNLWRIDLQLGWNIDKEKEKAPERVIPRLKAMLGEEVDFELEWVSIYSFQCRRMAKFRHGRMLFAGDAAHQVSPFGARGANSGLQDTDNLVWKLKLVRDRSAPESLLDTYDAERIHGADENILNSSRSTDFITPKSEMSRLFRDAALDLSGRAGPSLGRSSIPAGCPCHALTTARRSTGPTSRRCRVARDPARPRPTPRSARAGCSTGSAAASSSSRSASAPPDRARRRRRRGREARRSIRTTTRAARCASAILGDAAGGALSASAPTSMSPRAGRRYDEAEVARRAIAKRSGEAEPWRSITTPNIVDPDGFYAELLSAAPGPQQGGERRAQRAADPPARQPHRRPADAARGVRSRDLAGEDGAVTIETIDRVAPLQTPPAV